VVEGTGEDDEEDEIIFQPLPLYAEGEETQTD
jgi:hypothetical protein